MYIFILFFIEIRFLPTYKYHHTINFYSCIAMLIWFGMYCPKAEAKSSRIFLILLMLVLTWMGTSQRCLFKYYLNKNKLLSSNFFSLHDILFSTIKRKCRTAHQLLCWSCYFSQQAMYFLKVFIGYHLPRKYWM